MKKIIIVMMFLSSIVFAGQDDIKQVKMLGGNVYENIVNFSRSKHQQKDRINMEIDNQCMAFLLSISTYHDPADVVNGIIVNSLVDDPLYYDSVFDVPVDWVLVFEYVKEKKEEVWGL